MTQQHTPTPWAIHEPLECHAPCGYPHNRTVIVHRNYEVKIADCGTRSRVAHDNAAFIVKAINSHDAFAAAVRLFVHIRDSGRTDMDADEVLILDAALALVDDGDMAPIAGR